MIKAASYGRKNKIPYLGLCYGMQLAVVAFARDVLGWKDANTTENDPTTSHDVIHLIPKQEEGTELEFVIMVIAVSCVKLLSAHNSTQHTSRKHKV
jgi:CTP synthase (EC 6.3.4.2)